MTVAQVKELANTPKDSSFTNDQYAAFANSIVTVEYYTGSGKSMKITRVSSAAASENDGNQDLAKLIKKGRIQIRMCIQTW